MAQSPENQARFRQGTESNRRFWLTSWCHEPPMVSPGPIEGTVRIETNDEEFKVLEVPVSGYILE